MISKKFLIPALAVLQILLIVATILSLVAQRIGFDDTQAAQHRQGVEIEAKLCKTLDREAALKPPPGNPVNNPSRAYEQQQHVILSGLAPDVGCRK